jgi:hypothetical protein
MDDVAEVRMKKKEEKEMKRSDEERGKGGLKEDGRRRCEGQSRALSLIG